MPTWNHLSRPHDEHVTWHLSQHTVSVSIPMWSTSLFMSPQPYWCPGAVASVRSGAAEQCHKQGWEQLCLTGLAMCLRQQHSPGHSKLWFFSETGEDWTHTSSHTSSRPVPRLLDEWAAAAITSTLKSLPTKLDSTQFETEHVKFSSLHPWASRPPYPGCIAHCVILWTHSLK